MPELSIPESQLHEKLAASLKDRLGSPGADHLPEVPNPRGILQLNMPKSSRSLTVKSQRGAAIRFQQDSNPPNRLEGAIRCARWPARDRGTTFAQKKAAHTPRRGERGPPGVFALLADGESQRFAVIVDGKNMHAVQLA